MLKKLAEAQIGQLRTEFGTAGYVQYVNHMGDDASIVEQARVTSDTTGRSRDDDTRLLEYLFRHRHTTPFEFCEIVFELQLPIDVARQLIRHRTASTNEYSTRYSEAIDHANTQGPYRKQSTSNRQGSGEEVVVADPKSNLPLLRDGSPQAVLKQMELVAIGEARECYTKMLDVGVAREQARRVLPLSTYTRMRWKLDLHNLFHFLGLRLDAHAQQEIRELAEGIARIVQFLYPRSWEAFSIYRLGAVTLSGRDVQAYKLWIGTHDIDGFKKECKNREIYPTHRELTEAIAKFERLEAGT